jgi:hypothetical protein
MVRRTHPTKNFSRLSSWAFGPPINYEKFMKGIPLTLNLELFRPDQRVVPSNIESAPGYSAGEIQGFLTPRFREYPITFWRKSGTFEVRER